MIRRLILITFLATSGAFAAIALVDHTAGGPVTAGTPFTTTAINTTGATLLVVVRVDNTGNTLSTGISFDDKVGGISTGNIWRYLTAQTTGSPGTQVLISYSYNSAGGALVVGANHTFFGNPGGNTLSMAASAWSGTKTSADPFASVQNGAHTAASPGGASSLATGNITPPSDGCLIISGTGVRSGTSYTSTLTLLDAVDWITGQRTGIAHSYQIQTTATIVGTTWTIGSGGTDQISVAIAAFLPAAGSTIRRRWYGQ